MTRLDTIFRARETVLIPYVMAGDPDLETTELVVRALASNGAAAVELGVPYGDPLADGPTIAAAGVRALRGGTGVAEVLQLTDRLRDCLPVVLFTYYNPVLQYGLRRFAREAALAGAAGAIVPDVALEEGEELRAALLESGLQMPLLVAPSTPRDRAARIAAASSGFIYVVSRLGVTGAGAAPDFGPLLEQLAGLRAQTEKPLAVGFGLSRAEHVALINGSADAVIVGSALVEAYAGQHGANAATQAARFFASLHAIPGQPS